MKKSNLNLALLAGTALIAAGSFATSAQAADLEAAGAVATPTDLTTVVAADNILNATDSNGTDAAHVDVNGGKSVTNINFDHNGVLAVYDTDATTAESLAASGYFDVASGTTTTVVFGDSEADGTGTAGDAAATLSIAGTLGEDGATTLTRGGTLAIVGAANETSGLGTLSVAGNTLLTNVDVTGGAGGAAEGGTAVNGTFGDAATDTFNVTTLDVTGGAGSGAVDSANGGAATVVVNAAATIGGATTVTGGNDAAGAGGGADGGNAVLTFGSSVTSTSTLAVSTGTAAAAGTNGSATVNFGGDATFTAITLEEGDSGTATLNFNGTSAQTVTGTINGATGANEGVITVTGAGGSVTFASEIGGTNALDAASVSANATANFDASAEFDGTLTNNGTVTVGVNSTLDVDAVAGTGSFVFDVNDADGTLAAADIGRMQLGNAAAITLANASVNVTGMVGTGTVDFLLGGAGGGANAFSAAGALSDNSALYTFTAAADGQVTVAQVDTATLTESKATKAAADQLLSVGATATGNLGTAIDNMASAASAAAVDDVVESTTSDVAGGGAIAALTVSNQTATATNARLAALRTGETGMAAGNHGEGLKTWGQAFGTTAEQDERDGVQGYDADTIGFAAGVDTENLIDGGIVGLAFSYANTEVESDAADSAETDVDSYQVTLYGDYDIDANTFVSAQLGYAWSKNDTTRKNVGGISGVTATGDYDADQFSVRTEVGRDYDVDGITVTPSVLANYVHYSADTYTETGAGTANLTVDAEDLNVFELGLGVDVSQTHEYADGSAFKPVLSLGVRHDLVGDEFEANNTFAGGGSAFKVEGFDPAQTTFNAGIAGTYFADENWEVTAEYDYEFKSDYSAHSGLVKAAYKF